MSSLLQKSSNSCDIQNIDTWPLELETLKIANKTIIAWNHEHNNKFKFEHSWDLLNINQEIMSLLNFQMSEDSNVLSDETGEIILGKGTKILPGVYIEGQVTIGENCKIGPNCYLRGPVSIGDYSHVGQAVEIKNSIVGSRTSIGHLSYVGDSIIGNEVNFGAGTITSNLRHDQGHHKTMINGKLINTNRRKLGAIIGNGARTGINTSFYPARKMGPFTTTNPGMIVREDIH